jgi:hypothetical protein
MDRKSNTPPAQESKKVSPIQSSSDDEGDGAGSAAAALRARAANVAHRDRGWSGMKYLGRDHWLAVPVVMGALGLFFCLISVRIWPWTLEYALHSTLFGVFCNIVVYNFRVRVRVLSTLLLIGSGLALGTPMAVLHEQVSHFMKQKIGWGPHSPLDAAIAAGARDQSEDSLDATLVELVHPPRGSVGTVHAADATAQHAFDAVHNEVCCSPSSLSSC